MRETKPITRQGNSEPIPDLAIVRPPLRGSLQHHPYLEGISWLVECSDSTPAKDLSAKKQLYAEAGIREYWVVDLKSGQLRIFREVKNGDYQMQLTL